MRRRDSAEPAERDLPEWLYFESFRAYDWVRPGERPANLADTINGKPPTARDVDEALAVAAWGRWKEARRKWADENGVAWRDLPVPGKPRFDR